MSLFGVDYSAGVPSVAALKAAGVAFVCRYVSPGDRRKDLTRGEADAMRAGGLQVVTVYEDTVGDARGGHAAGATNARFVAAELARLGAPPGAPCYFAVDYDAQGALLATAVAYVRGAAEVLGHGRTGVYGGYDVVKACLDAGACRYAWQAVAWSEGRWDPRAHIQQHLGQVVIGGVTCDRDFATQPDYGQWDRQEDNMALSAEDRTWIKQQIDAAVSLLYRGDRGTPETHPANLEQLRADVGALKDALAGGGQVAPAYEGTVSLTPRAS